MKFKLDENFGTRTQQIFRDTGHDIHTVRDEQLQGCQDVNLFKICCGLKRSLILKKFRNAGELRTHLETRAWS